MPAYLVVILYFGCIAIVIGGLYGVFRLTGGSGSQQGEINEGPTIISEDMYGNQKTLVPGEEAFDKDGYILTESGEKSLDADGNYRNILALWAETFLGAEVDANDFGVDEEGYCYRPSTGERYTTPDGREFTAQNAKDGGFGD